MRIRRKVGQQLIRLTLGTQNVRRSSQPLDLNCLQTLIAGGNMVLAHKSFVLAWFLRISKYNGWVSQSIMLQLAASDEDPMYMLKTNLIVPIRFCTTKSDIPTFNLLSITCTNF